MTNEEIRRVLIDARALIDTPDKWYKKDMPCKTNSKCINTAISNTSMFRMEYFEALGFNSLVAVWDFNDDPNTTHEMMLARFDKAIANLAPNKTKPSVIDILLMETPPVDLVEGPVRKVDSEVGNGSENSL